MAPPRFAAAPPVNASPSTAAAVLGELRRRYAKWSQRNVNYSRLLAFLSFVVLLLAVLFLQRSANARFQVRGGCPPPAAAAGSLTAAPHCLTG